MCVCGTVVVRRLIAILKINSKIVLIKMTMTEPTNIAVSGESGNGFIGDWAMQKATNMKTFILRINKNAFMFVAGVLSPAPCLVIYVSVELEYFKPGIVTVIKCSFYCGLFVREYSGLCYEVGVTNVARFVRP